MLFKRTLFAAFVTFSLLAMCLHATPVRRTAVGDKASVTLSKLDGTITFTQTAESVVTASGQVNKGITENDPDKYFVIVAGVKKSFKDLGIKIKVPGTESFSASGPGDLVLVIGQTLEITHVEEVLDQGTITQP